MKASAKKDRLESLPIFAGFSPSEMTISDLPAINASLNALSACLIVAGLVFIKTERKQAHIISMVSALCSSTLFLACYLTYHFNTVAVTRFTHPGWPKTIYLFILFTHIPLAGAILPLVFLTVIPALRARYDKHRRWATITAPLWLYVSVTGVLVYLMLYVWYPPVK
jgi:putative membrane protein